MLPKKQNIQAIILAAGSSQRFNGIKQLASTGHQTLVELALSNCLDIGPRIRVVSLVLGANADQVRRQIPARLLDKICIIVASDWQHGMGRSLGQAIASVEEDVSHILIGLADQVAVTSEYLGRLVDASQQSPTKIIASCYKSTRGAPVIFPRDYFQRLSLLSGDQGAKSLLREYKDNLVLVDMPNAAVDIDTREDLENWLAGNTA